MNPFDEISIEAAVRMRERKSPPVDDILALSAGPAKCVDVLRTAMAMGADRSIHVEIPDAGQGQAELEPLGVAKLLAKVVADEGRNLVILGKQSIDDDSSQTGQMLAGLLGWGQATQASKIEIDDSDRVSVTREVDGGVETVRFPLPGIITTDLRLNEPRYASLPNIMKAKKKKLEKKSLSDYGVDERRRLKTVKVEGKCWLFAVIFCHLAGCIYCIRAVQTMSQASRMTYKLTDLCAEPPPRKGGGKVEDVDGMIAKLKELGAI